MQLPQSIFRAYDIRGVVGETLTVDIVQRIGHAFGSEARSRGFDRVVVGRDGRLSGPELIAALIDGVRAAGADVVDLGMVPTPVLYFATEQLGTGTGIALTGSHNPANYNGLKLMIGGGTLHGEEIQTLYRRGSEGDLLHGSGELEHVEILSDYLARVSGDIKLERPLRVAVDCGNGVAGVIAPELLRQLGCEVVELYSEVDGTFPNHHPNPSVPANLEELIACVREQRLDLGLAFDGDGDRLGVVDAEGRIIWPDRQMILYASDILARNPGAAIIYDIKCSRHLGDAISRAGGEPIMWKTGHSLIKAKLKESGALLAGEMSGHIFFKERWYGFDDALYTAARLLEIVSHGEQSPTERFQTLPDSVNTPELNVHFAQEGAHFAFMERFKAIATLPEAEITTLDGLRADFADGWGLVRPSNTTPSLVIRFEAEDDAGLERIKGLFREQMLAADETLKLPF